MSTELEKNDSSSSTTVGYSDNATTTASTMETPKPKKKKSKKEPKLAKDETKELHASGKFFGGVAELKIDKTDLEMLRTQRIILTDDNGKQYVFTRI